MRLPIVILRSSRFYRGVSVAAAVDVSLEPLRECAVGEDGDERYTEALLRTKVGDELTLKRWVTCPLCSGVEPEAYYQAVKVEGIVDMDAGLP